MTDCQSLIYLNTVKTKNPQIIRWYNMSTEFDFTIKHKPREELAHADALSRAPLDDEVYDDGNLIDRVAVFMATSFEDEVTLYQYTDEILPKKIDTG